MKKYHLILIILFLSVNIMAQEMSPIAKQVQETKSFSSQEFDLIENILIPSKKTSVLNPQLKNIQFAVYFDYDKQIAQQLLKSPKEAVAIEIPYSHKDGSYLILDLIKVPDSFYDYVITTSSGEKFSGRDIAGVHYRGIVRDKELSSLVALSVFENEITGIISISGRGTINIGKLSKKDQHIIYDDAHLKSSEYEDLCLTSGDGEQNPVLDDLYANVLDETSDNSADKCLKIYFETDYDMYTHFGSSETATANFVSSIFNEVATLFMNESITMEISEIFVWNTPDSYSSSTSTGLDQFVAQRPTFNGDLAHLLSFRTGNSNPNNLSNAGGIANWFGGVCVTGNPDLSPHSHTRLFPDFETFPVFSRQVKVITHEIGHNLGSRHTHACVWNENDTAIDGCSGTEGACNIPLLPPTNTGTIMSYCDRNVGIDFTLGFGPQPGNVIRNFVSSLTCVEDCSDCFDDITHTGTITSATYEVSNSITSTATIGSNQNVTYDAGNFICLNPTFEAEAGNGSVFLAHIDGCNNALVVQENSNTQSESINYSMERLVVNTPPEQVSIKNYPNPFTGQTTIEFTLEQDVPVTLFVSDLTGKQIAVLLDNEQKFKGTHQAIFDGNNYLAGMYYYTIQAGDYVATQKMTLVK